jgi:hypothetical protein
MAIFFFVFEAYMVGNNNHHGSKLCDDVFNLLFITVLNPYIYIYIYINLCV